MLQIKLTNKDDVIYIYENNKWIYYTYDIIDSLDGGQYALLRCNKPISIWKFVFVDKNFDVHRARKDIVKYSINMLNMDFPFEERKGIKYITIVRNSISNYYDSALDYNETVDFYEAYKLAQKMNGGLI